MITSHTDVVGSLLRPPQLLEARKNKAELTPAEFKAIEDRAHRTSLHACNVERKGLFMKSSELLIVDGIGNLVLGFLFMAFPQWLIEFLGLPNVSSSFYLSVFGAILFGIGIALLVECFRRPMRMVGLGLGGAIAINLCFGIVLALWLVFGGLDPSPLGTVILWALVAILILISTIEIFVTLNKRQSIASHGVNP